MSWRYWFWDWWTKHIVGYDMSFGGDMMYNIDKLFMYYKDGR